MGIEVISPTWQVIVSQPIAGKIEFEKTQIGNFNQISVAPAPKPADLCFDPHPASDWAALGLGWCGGLVCGVAGATAPAVANHFFGAAYSIGLQGTLGAIGALPGIGLYVGTAIWFNMQKGEVNAS